MTILAASVVSKAGRPLVARAFNPNMSRSRLESLLLSFVKLIPPGAQHTTLLSPDGSIRYVYMPIDELYVCLLTPPLSNILQDIDTLHLLGRIVTEMCSVGSVRGGVGESEVLRNAFELLSAFDEVISLGHRERVGMTEVRAAMEMESHEERIQDIIARNKEQEAKEELKRRAKQLEMQRREMLRRGQNPYAPGGPGMRPAASSGFEQVYTPAPAPVVQNVGGDYGGPSAQSAKPAFKSKGMQLGAKGAKKQADLLESLGGAPVPEERQSLMSSQEHDITPAAALAAVSPIPAATPAAAPKPENPFGPVDEEEVHTVIREKLSLALNRDGGLEFLELKGDLDLRISSADVSKVILKLSHSDAFSAQDLQFKTHPRIDKKAWTDAQKIQLRDTKQGFPVRQGLAVLKWRLTSKDESVVPLSINCWPSPTDDGSIDVNIEYELVSEIEDMHLKNIVISIPLPAGAYPGSVTAAEGTSWSLDGDSHALNWSIPDVDAANEESKSGVLEFNVPGEDVGAFFPVAVDFVAQTGLCGVKVEQVSAVEGGDDVPYSTESLLSTEDFAIV